MCVVGLKKKNVTDTTQDTDESSLRTTDDGCRSLFEIAKLSKIPDSARENDVHRVGENYVPIFYRAVLYSRLEISFVYVI